MPPHDGVPTICSSDEMEATLRDTERKYENSEGNKLSIHTSLVCRAMQRICPLGRIHLIATSQQAASNIGLNLKEESRKPTGEWKVDLFPSLLLQIN